MKFKALILALLAIIPATCAMDKPANSAIEAQKHVDPEDVCPVCLKQAKDLPPDKIRITNCCKQFICDYDARTIFSGKDYRARVRESIKQQLRSTQQQLSYTGLQLTSEQLKQMSKIAKQSISSEAKHCPSCSQKKWSASSALVKTLLKSKPALTIIDSENNMFELRPDLSAALYQCSLLEMYDDQLNTQAEPLDYSNVKSDQNRFLKKELIIKLAQLIKDPVKETQNMVQNVEFFELAKYLAAPDNILYLIANELWPLMQEQKEDNAQIKTYKKYVLELARPHLASPKQLIEYKEFNQKGRYLGFIVRFPNGRESYDVNLSWPHIFEQLKNEGWYQNEKHSWYKVYPFCKWDGIQQICFKSLESYEREHCKIAKLNLTGHRLETISESLLEMMSSQDDIGITLDHNPINSIDESFFERIAKNRPTGQSITVSLIDNHLTDKQKEEFNKKWHQATTTYVQKYMTESTYKSLVKGVGCLGSALAVHYLSHKAHDFVQGFSGLTSIIGGAILGYKIVNQSDYAGHGTGLLCGIAGAIAVPVGLGYLFDKYPKAFALPTHMACMPVGAYITKKIADYAVIKLAKKSHPEIQWEADNMSWNANDKAWNTNYHLKF